MAKTIEQLTIQANEIKLATDRGENTAARVGGLFSDLVDYIAEFEQNDIVLGPLLTALNNSNLLDPEDGQTLTFSILDDNWTFSSAITQLKISQEGIERTVASNYQATLLAQTQLNAYIEGVEETVRTNKRGYDADQVEYMTWHRQTDTSIGTFAAALTVDGDIISMSYVLQTCDNIEQAVTNNWNAYVAEKDRLENTIFGYTEGGTFHNGILQNLNAVTQESSGTASWINQNSSQISAVVANFDSNGNPTAASGIVTTSTYSGLFTAAMSANGVVTSGNISVYLTDFVDEEGVEQIISVAEIGADKIKFNMTFDWTVKNSQDETIFKLDSNGNLTVAGNIKGGQISDNVAVGTVGNKMEIYVDETGYGQTTTSGLRGFDSSNNELLNLRVLTNSGTGGELYLKSSSGYNSTIFPNFASFGHPNNGTAVFGWYNDKIYIYGGLSSWPTLSQTVVSGQVYIDNGYLKVRTS